MQNFQIIFLKSFFALKSSRKRLFFYFFFLYVLITSKNLRLFSAVEQLKVLNIEQGAQHHIRKKRRKNLCLNYCQRRKGKKKFIIKLTWKTFKKNLFFKRKWSWLYKGSELWQQMKTVKAVKDPKIFSLNPVESNWEFSGLHAGLASPWPGLNFCPELSTWNTVTK